MFNYNALSLSREVLLQMAMRISVIVIIIAGLSYGHIASILEEQTFDSLGKYITERGRKESAIFELAEDNHKVFKQRFIDAYNVQKDVSDQQFYSVFESLDDGTTRLQKKAFEGFYRDTGTFSHGTTAFVGPNAPIDKQEFRNRLYLAYNMVDRYGDAWTHRFANVYVGMLENVNIVHWPSLPWADNASPELDITIEEWVYITTQENNPSRESVWTGLYYDPTANEWMVSCETPIDIDQKHLLNIGHDMLLTKLFDRVFNDHLTGAYNFIVRDDGRLIAHPEKVEALEKSLGMLDLTQGEDVTLYNMYQQIKTEIIDPNEPNKILDSASHNALLAVSKIEGPDWYFVTVYPKTLMTSMARKAAQFIFTLGVISLVLEMLAFYLLLKNRILSPINMFNIAIKQINKRNYSLVANGKTPLPEGHHNEIGKLARTLRSMAQSIAIYSADMEKQQEYLELEVKNRTEELEAAKLVAENLARIDELTQIPNRRFFNEMASKQLAFAQRHNKPISWCIIDVDFFKNVNDTYGHSAGDAALIALTQLLKDAIRDSDLLARVGGEEFIISFPNTSRGDCKILVERFRIAVEQLVIISAEHTFSITISGGISGGVVGEYDYSTLYSSADNALYASKENGRNRISFSADCRS